MASQKPGFGPKGSEGDAGAIRGVSDKEQLDEIAGAYDPSSPESSFDYWFIQLNFTAMEPYLRGRRLLELGCSSGVMSGLLSGRFERHVVVDGSAENLDRARARSEGKAEYIHSMWEEYEPDEPFDQVVFTRGLEHLDEPVAMLERIRGWLAPGGRVHIAVPNARSLHRRLGVEMGMIERLDELHDWDIQVGHKRVYDKELLFRHLRGAGLRAQHWQGIVLKPLSNSQMKDWPEDTIRALYEVGKEFPDLCGELYVVATSA